MRGWLNAPMMFFTPPKFTATLPPTLESTAESSVVGICTKGTPRRNTAAANPPRSPTTPPPSRSTSGAVAASGNASSSAAQVFVNSSQFFPASPAVMSCRTIFAKPESASDARTFSK